MRSLFLTRTAQTPPPSSPPVRFYPPWLLLGISRNAQFPQAPTLTHRSPCQSCRPRVSDPLGTRSTAIDFNALQPMNSNSPRGKRDQDPQAPPMSAQPGRRNPRLHTAQGTRDTNGGSRSDRARRSSEPSRASRRGNGASSKGRTNGGFLLDRFGRRIPKADPTPLESARRLKDLRDGWNQSAAEGRMPTSAEFSRGVGWDETLVSGVEAMELSESRSECVDSAGSMFGGDLGTSHSSLFLRTDCRALWRRTTRGEGSHRSKLDMVFGDDFAELVGAGATRVGWMNGALADPADGGHAPGEANVNKALAAAPPQPADHAMAARRVEAAKYSAAKMGRDAVIAKREAAARGKEVERKRAAARAAEEVRLRAARAASPLDHAEEMRKRMAKIREERTGDICRASYNAKLRERTQQEEKIRKTNAVRSMRSDIKLMEDIKARQTARLRQMERERIEEEELQSKTKVVIKMQRIFRHYLPIRLARLKRELETKMAQTGGAPKRLHKTMGPKIKITNRQERLLKGEYVYER